MTNEKKATAKLFLAMSVFGTVGIFVNYIPLPSGIIAFSRGIIGVIFLLLLVLIKRQKIDFKAIRKNLAVLIFSGAAIGVNWILLFEAYRHTIVSTATLCYYMSPIFVILASPFLLKERLTAKKIICVLTAFCGMILVSGVFNVTDANALDLTGILFGLGAALFYAGVVILNKRLHDISDNDMTMAQLLIAAITVLPYSLIMEKISPEAITPIAIILLIAVGVLHTGFSYTLYFGSIKRLKAQTVAVFGYIDPVVSLLLSAIILGDNIGILGYIGAVLILGSAFLSEITLKKK